MTGSSPTIVDKFISMGMKLLPIVGKHGRQK
jgi:hypothetical protein